MPAEDFMDEEDANDFGGPVGVRSDYGGGGSGAAMAATGGRTGDDDDLRRPTLPPELDVTLFPSTSTERDPVGRRLLRALGWRGDPSGGGGGGGGG